MTICQVCYTEQARWAMYPTIATDESRSNGGDNKPVPMCQDCAFDAWENGTYEADGELDE